MFRQSLDCGNKGGVPVGVLSVFTRENLVGPNRRQRKRASYLACENVDGLSALSSQCAHASDDFALKATCIHASLSREYSVAGAQSFTKIQALTNGRCAGQERGIEECSESKSESACSTGSFAVGVDWREVEEALSDNKTCW